MRIWSPHWVFSSDPVSIVRMETFDHVTASKAVPLLVPVMRFVVGDGWSTSTLSTPLGVTKSRRRTLVTVTGVLA